MLILLIVLLVLTSLVAAAWTTRHLLIAMEHRDGFLLTEAYPGPPNRAPFISVLVAAKDEADNIEPCLRTMLTQDYPNFELIVCNDRSEDDTGAIVERIAQEDPRVRVIDIEHLPEGWCGKNNAMQTGIATTQSEWICMIDADCYQRSPRTLSTAMQYARDTDADLLSVLPVFEMRTFWENVVQPVCGGVMMIWFNPKKVNDPRSANAYANGAFMLMKRSTYEAIGTHEAVKGEVNEDMQMAARIKACGLKLRVVRNHGLYTVRMYTSLRRIISGWARIFYGTFGTLGRISVSLGVLFIMGLLPYVSAVLGFSQWATAGSASGWWLGCALVGVGAVAMQLSVIYRFYKLIGARKDLAWTYPIGCAVAILAATIALTKLRKGAKVTWRGTSYSSASA